MGNRLPKLSKKNRVEPAPKEEDVHELISRSTEFRTPKANAPEDMVKALNGEASGTADPTSVTDKAAATDSKKAVAFTVELEDEKVEPRMPKRLAEMLHEEKELKHEAECYVIDYTWEEEALMADIVREDRLKKRIVKARQEDIKSYDANRRRMVVERTKEA